MQNLHFSVQDQKLKDDQPHWFLKSGGNIGSSTFLCNLLWCMEMCHKTFSPSADIHMKMLIYYIFSFKCRFEMAVMHLYWRKPHKRYQCKTYISECKIKSWKMIDPLIWLTRMSPKIFQFRFSLDMVNDDWLPPGIWYLVEMLEILLLYILCYDACKFATNLFIHQLRAIWKC